MKNKNNKIFGDSQSVSKVLNQFNRLLNKEKVENKILEIRNALGIPLNGYSMTPEDRREIGSIFHVPSAARGERRIGFLKRCNTLIKPITNEFVIPSTFLGQVLRCYIFYNSLEVDEIAIQMSYSEKTALCQIKDERLSLDERFWGEPDAYLATDYARELIRDAEHYPVIIKINPAASRRDVVDYIESNWPRIEELLVNYAVEKHRIVKNYKVRVNQENRKVADFVYKHRHLKLKEIKALLYEELGVTKGYEEIGKIKSLETQRRKGE